MTTEPRKYRKKPVVIEAMRLWSYTELLPPGSWNQLQGGAVWQWMHRHGADVGLGQDSDDEAAYGVIPTLEGDMRANIGDYIIRGVQGEFYPCKPDIFVATYEEA